MKEESKFVVLINHEGRVKVDITGPHVNKTVFNRMTLAIKKVYRNHIREYRLQVKRDMNTEQIEKLVAKPAKIEVSSNGKLIEIEDIEIQTLPIERTNGLRKSEVFESIQSQKPYTEEEVKSVDKTYKDIKIQETLQPKKLTLQEILELKRAQRLSERK